MLSKARNLITSSRRPFRIAVLLGVIVIGTNLGLFGLCRHVMLESFLRLEKKHAAEHLNRAVNTLNASIDALAANVTDEAVWDSSYQFIADGNADYIRMNLVDSVFTELDIDLILFIRTDGTIVYFRCVAPGTEGKSNHPEELAQSLRQTPNLWNFTGVDQSRRGLWRFSSDIWVFASHPILTSQGQGPVRGALMMARKLDNRRVETLASIVNLSLNTTPAQEINSPVFPDYGINLLGDEAHVETALVDVFGQPALNLAGRIPSEILHEGQRAIGYFLTWSSGLSLALGSVIYGIWAGLFHSREQRRERESLFRRLTDQAPEAFFLFRPDHPILDFNTRACEMLGYAHEELQKISWAQIEAQIGFFLVEELLETIPEGQAVTSEGHLRRRDGSEIPVEWSASRLQWEKENYILVLARDIRERKESERVLREGKQKFEELSLQFQTVLDGIADSIMLIAPDRSILWANLTARQLSPNFAPHTDCHENWRGMIHEEGFCPVEKCLSTGLPVESIGHGSQNTLWGIKVFPLKDAGGEVTHVIQVASDITEKIRLRKEAEQAGRLAALGEMSAGIAHEINNPTAYLLLNFSFLQEVFNDLMRVLEELDIDLEAIQVAGLPMGRVQEKTPNLLAEMHKGAGRIKRIVEDLKNFARPGSDRPAELVNLNQVVETSIRLTSHLVRKRTRNFSVSLSPELPVLAGDAQRLEQVAINLLLNACQALEHADQGIQVATRYVSEGAEVLLEIRDEGRGITQENLEKIFHPFFTTRREEGGTGLGLPVSMRIVEDHGGALEFQSAPGVGTIVTLKLPTGG